MGACKRRLELINVGTKQDKRELKIRMLITANMRNELVAFLPEYIDVFAWSYVDIPNLDTEIIVRELLLIEGCKLIKRKLWRIRPDILIKVKEEVKKKQ
jgi:hypothetical protein